MLAGLRDNRTLLEYVSGNDDLAKLLIKELAETAAKFAAQAWAI